MATASAILAAVAAVFHLAAADAFPSGPVPASFFSEAAFVFRLPQPLLVAISKVESGLRPWTLNIAGAACRYSTKEEALAAARAALKAGQSVDFGLMQVNSWWLRKYGVSPEAALDPLANVYFGSLILSREFERLGDMRSAIGAYHSPDSGRAERYVSSVMAAMGESGPAAAPAAPKHGQERRAAAAPARAKTPPAPEAAGSPMLVADGRPNDPPAAGLAPMTVARGGGETGAESPMGANPPTQRQEALSR